MSRRLTERALPNFSQLIDGPPQLELAQGDERLGVDQGEADRQGGVWPRLYVGRFWLECAAHAGHSAAPWLALSARRESEVSGEGGVTC